MKIPFTKSWRDERRLRHAELEKAAQAEQHAKRTRLSDAFKEAREIHEAIGFKICSNWSAPRDLKNGGATAVAPDGKVYRLTVYPEGGYDLKAL